MQQLNEYKLSNHWLDRKRERIDAMEIFFPLELFSSIENKEEIRSLLIEKIKFGIKTRLLAYEMLHDTDALSTNVTVFARISLKKDGKIFLPIEVQTVYERINT